MSQTLAAQVSYAMHDPQKHRNGETGLAVLMSFVRRVQQETGRAPSALVVQARPNIGNAACPDANCQLMTESMAMFGLPVRFASQHTHLGLCGARLQHPLRTVGSVAGVAMIWNYDRGECAR